MSTQAQFIANQANSQKSTGPKTEKGKNVSSQNRRTHGLGGAFTVLPCEDQSAYDHLLHSLDEEFQPQGPSELLLVETMAESRWLRNRALRLQETTLDPATAQIADQKLFALYQRYFTTHESGFNRALNALLKQRALTQSLAIGFEQEKRRQQGVPFQLALKEMEIAQRERKLGIVNEDGLVARASVVDQAWRERRERRAKVA